MPVTKADIIRELAKRELAKRQSGVIDKAVDAVKSFDESQSKGAATGVNLNLVGRIGLNPITDKSATMTGTEAERFAWNLISDPLRMGIGLIDQAVANPYEAVAGLVKAPIHILGNLYKGVFGTDEQKEQALQETINSPLSPLAVAAPAMGITGRAMTPASLRGVDIARLQRTTAEARMTSPIDLPPPEPVAPLQLTYKPDTQNLGVLRKRGEVVDRAMTPEEWQVWLANEEANAPVVRNYLTENGKRFATVNPKASVIPTDLSAKPSNTGEGFTFRNPRPGETPGLASQVEYKGSTPLQIGYEQRMQPEVSPKMQVQMNRGVSEISPTVPKTEPVASVQGGGKGKTYRVYHGTRAEFDKFDIKQAGQSDPGLVGRGVYFAANKDQAMSFANNPYYGPKAKGTARVVEADVNLSNPVIIQDGKLPDGRTLTDIHPNGINKDAARKINGELRKAGYDGAVFKIGDDVTQVVSFDTKNISTVSTNYTRPIHIKSPTPPSPVGKAKEPAIEVGKTHFEKRKYGGTAKVKVGSDHEVWAAASGDKQTGWKQPKATDKVWGVIRHETSGRTGERTTVHIADRNLTRNEAIEIAKKAESDLKAKEGGVEYREAGLRPQVISENMPEPVKRVFYSAEGRITLPESKALFSDIELSTQTQKANLEGPWMEETRSTGLGKLDEAGANQVRAELESGNLGSVPSAPKIFGLVPKGKTTVATERLRTVLEDIWTQAKAAGIEIGKVKNYFPRIIKREIAERINDDLRSVVAELEKSENVSDVAVAKALEKADAKTKQIITHMIETGQAKGYNDAVQNLYHAAQHDLYKVTSFEKHRSQLTELPSWVYEQDARKVIPLYIEAMSKRIADAKVFGPNGEKAAQYIDDIASKDMAEANLVREVYNTHAGLQQSLHPMSSVSKQAVNALTGFLYGTKITVKSTIPNLVQTMHSVAKDYGIHRMNQAIVRLATDKTFREQIRKTGVVDLDMMTAMSGYHPGGVWGKFADIATKVQGFKAANRMNQYLSAGTAKVFIEEAYAKARGEKNVWFGNRRREWFQQELADLGIDYTKPLDDAATARAMYKVASDTQLMHNILKEPVWMNNQRLRVLALFKRFAYRQAKYQVDTLTKEFKRGNVVPALRLAAQGYIAAKFTGWANEQLRKALSGEQVYSDNEGWREFVEALAQIGAVGVFSDIAGGLATQTPTKAVVDKTKFAMTPVVADAAQKGMELGSRVAGDVDKLGAGPAFRKNVDEILQFVSPVLGYVGDRMLTQREQSYRDVYRKADKKNEILDVILMGDAERAKRMIQRWNEANKNNPALVLTGKDINGKAVKSRAENKAKAQAGVR